MDLLWVHLAATWFMVGLVWFVQCVHYPLLRDLPAEIVPAYQLAHMRRTSPLIPTVMILEAATGISIYDGSLWWIINTALLLFIWLLTFLVIVPLHVRLSEKYNPTHHGRLLVFNLVRSLAWLGHGITAIVLLRTHTQ